LASAPRTDSVAAVPAVGGLGLIAGAAATVGVLFS
jgi:hypothetical protein